jgi:hypothetical protein
MATRPSPMGGTLVKDSRREPAKRICLGEGMLVAAIACSVVAPPLRIEAAAPSSAQELPAAVLCWQGRKAVVAARARGGSASP